MLLSSVHCSVVFINSTSGLFFVTVCIKEFDNTILSFIIML